MLRKCTCDHFSPPLRVLRSVEFNRELAQYYCDQPSSGDAIVNDVLTQIYDFHDGRLIGLDGRAFPVDSEAGDRFFTSLFGEDPRRFINRFREKAARPPKNLLHRRCILPVAILHLARQIHLCRTRGACSR